MSVHVNSLLLTVEPSNSDVRASLYEESADFNLTVETRRLHKGVLFLRLFGSQ
jgi:hypothetical protein